MSEKTPQIQRFTKEEFDRIAGLLKPKTNRYFKHQPWPKQAAFLLLDQKEALFGGSGGGGKLLVLTTPILTSNGWKTIGTLEVGDEVFSELGQPVKVLHVYDIIEKPKSYRITFDDKTTIECCADHLWHTYTTKDVGKIHRRDYTTRATRRANRPKRGTGKRPDLAERNARIALAHKSEPVTGAVRTTQEIFETQYNHRGKNNHSILMHSALEMPRRDLPVDPYCLGAWLGDGSTGSGVITGIDPEILEEFEKAGYEVSHHKCEKSHCALGLITQLRPLGITGAKGSKFIPDQYLMASKEQRLALLQGLMDTDGTVCDIGSVEFTNTNERIARGAYQLILSLGWKTTLRKKRAKLYGKDCGPNWRLKFYPDQYVFRLPRKVALQRLVYHRRSKQRYITNVQPIDPKPMRCIKVDNPTGLFLVGEQLITTHNSDALLMAALQYVDVPGYSALILRKSFADLSKPGAIMDRARDWLSPFPEARWNDKLKTFTFPSGARLTFGYLDTAADKYTYQGAEYQYIGFDELTQFPKSEYTYLFSRLRKTQDINVPLRVRAATNPGGMYPQWVYERFIKNVDNAPVSERIFIPALIQDNPALNYEEYKKSLDELDEVTRAQMLYGDWDARPEGLVYPEFEQCVFDPTVDWREGMPEGEHFGGIDWGFTSPFCCLVGVLDKNQHLWIYFERYMRGATIPEHAAVIPKDKDVIIFADPALPESIAQMRKLDFTVRKANNDIKTGIQVMKNWIRKGRLHISIDCKSLLEESKLYRYKHDSKNKTDKVGDNDEGGDPEIPIKKNDHACDSCRYLVTGVHKLIGGFKDDESNDDEVRLPENTVQADKRWKLSDIKGDQPTKEELDEYYSYKNDMWWNR